MVRHTGEDFIDVEGVAVASMLSLQSSGVYGSEFDAPEADRLPTDSDAALGQEIFDIAVTPIDTGSGQLLIPPDQTNLSSLRYAPLTVPRVSRVYLSAGK